MVNDATKKAFIKEFESINKIKCFEFKETILYINIENDFLIAGSICNAGIIPEFKMQIDFDLTVDQNLQNFYNYILENANFNLLED